MNNFNVVLWWAAHLLLGKNINSAHQYRWLKVFDQDELKDFIQEINEAFIAVPLIVRYRRNLVSEMTILIHQ